MRKIAVKFRTDHYKGSRRARRNRSFGNRAWDIHKTKCHPDRSEVLAERSGGTLCFADAVLMRQSANVLLRSLTSSVILLAIVLFASPLRAQENTPLPQTPQATEEAPFHPFFDRTNLLLFSGVGIFRGLDYASTRNMQARGREEILLPDDVVNNSAGFAAVEAAGTVASIGLSYWMHRTGHHSIERWVSIAHISVTGFGVVRNYSLTSKHP
jgi:hypothetical protein